MKAFSFQQATSVDCQLIKTLAEKVWNHTYTGIHTQEQLDFMFEQMYSDESLQKQMENGHTFFVGYDQKKAIGYVSVEQKEENLFYLQKLYILPEYQGTGAGKFLFTSAVAYIKNIHPSPCVLELNVNRENKAIRFYEHMGMKKHRESDDSIGNGYVMNSCFMRKEI